MIRSRRRRSPLDPNTFPWLLAGMQLHERRLYKKPYMNREKSRRIVIAPVARLNTAASLAVICEGKIRPRLPSTVSSGFGAGFDIHVASRLSEVNRDARGTWL